MPQPSCYLLEYSVEPGGARHAHLYTHATLDGLRELMGDEVDPHKILWYRAVLHLWVVQEGRIVQGIDLHPLHTTATPTTIARCTDT